MSETTNEIAEWFAGRLPEDWFPAAPEVSVDREEILVVGELAADDGAEAPSDAARDGRIARWREETRGQRMRIADEAQQRFGRTVSWGATHGGTRTLFTHVSAPVMTRLRQPERMVLDTLVEAGVARSRSDALGWCVRLVAQHQGDWIAELHDALDAVRAARAAGPSA